MEQLHNLDRRPSHQSSFQPHVKLVEVVAIHVIVQQTQPLNQNVWLSVLIMGIIEGDHLFNKVCITHC